MTEPKFEVFTESFDDILTEIECNGQKLTYKEVANLLNKLLSENEQLKMAINSLKLLVKNWEALDEEKDEQLDKQNQALKKLKQENSNLRFEMSMYEQKIEDLEKELQE